MKPGRVIIGLVLILFGALFLAASLDWIEWSFFLSIWQLWPVVLVLVGIQLLFGRGRPALAAGLMVLVLVGAAALAVYAWETDGWAGWGKIETVTIEGPPVGGIDEASAVIDIGAAEVTIDGQSGDRVVAGRYESRGEPRIVQSTPDGPGSFEISINQEDDGRVWFVPFTPGSETLELQLAAGVPWTIDIDSGAADLTMDLSTVTLERLSVDAGASSVQLTVGREVVPGAEIVIQGGAGSYELRLPASLDVTVTTETGLSSVDFDDDFKETSEDVWEHDGGGPDLTVEVSAGVSSVDVTLY